MPPRRRSAEQLTRRFLSRALRYDTVECSPSSAAAAVGFGPSPPQQQAFRLDVSLDAFENSGVPLTTLQLSVFDKQGQRFVGATHPLAVEKNNGVAAIAPHVASSLCFWAQSDQLLLVVEATIPDDEDVGGTLSGKGTVLGWGCCSISSLTALSEIAVHKGSAKLLYLDASLWPASGTAPVGMIRLRATELGVLQSVYLQRLTPEGVFAPFVDVFPPPAPAAAPSQAPLLLSATDATLPAPPTVALSTDPFRVVLEDITLRRLVAQQRSSGVPSFATRRLMDHCFRPGADVQLVVCAHSGFKMVSRCIEIPLQYSVDSENLVMPLQRSGAHSVISDIPRSRLVHLVLALRTRPASAGVSPTPTPASRTSAGVYETVALAAIPLDPSSDRDVDFENVPWIVGPWSTEDHRMTLLPDAALSSMEAVSHEVLCSLIGVGGFRSPSGGRSQLPSFDTVYAVAPLLLDGLVRYYDTAVPAPRIEEVLLPPEMNRPDKQPVPVIGSAVVASTPVACPADPSTQPTNTVAAVAAAAAVTVVPQSPPVPQAAPVTPSVALVASEAPLQQPAQLQPTTVTPVAAVPVVSAPSTVTVVPVAVPMSGVTSTAPPVQQTDVATYKLLCKILEELDGVRSQQEKLQQRILLAPTSMALGPRSPSAAPGGRPEDGAQERSEAFQLVDFAPRRAGISFATRCAINEGLRPIQHPVHGTPVSDGTLLPSGPDSTSATSYRSAYGLRLEGMTSSPPTLPLPQRLVGFMSFARMPLQAMAVLCLQRVVEEDGWITHRIVSQQDGLGGYFWSEMLDAPRDGRSLDDDSFALQFKSGSTLYLHFYDAVTMLYHCTATVPTSLFHRSPELAVMVRPLDVTLSVDYSMTQKVVPPTVLPVAQNVGVLHVSLVNIAVSSQQAASPSFGSTALSSSSSPSSGLPHVVVAQKIRCADPATWTAPTTSGGGSSSANPATASATTVDSSHAPPLHAMRLRYVRDLIQKNGGALPGVPAHHLTQRDAQEMEYRVRFVEKKRDEAKATKIAEVLRGRITKNVHCHAATGRRQLLHITFDNPFPVTCAFSVDISEQSQRRLRVGTALASCAASSRFTASPATSMTSGTTFLAGPRERIEIPFLVQLAPEDAVLPNGGSSRADVAVVHCQAQVKSVERGELVAVWDLHVTPVPAVIHRRYEIFGSPGTKVEKRLFSRIFSASQLPKDVSLTSAAACQRISSLCAYCVVSDPLTEATSRAVVDPVTQIAAAAWEEVHITTTIPHRHDNPNNNGSASRTVMLDLFHDADYTNHWETWELTVFPCEVLSLPSVPFGRSTTIAIPTGAEQIFCDDPQVQSFHPPASVDSPWTMRFKPRDTGPTQLLLHALQRGGGCMQKIIVQAHVSYPTPTYQYLIEMSQEEARMPLLRRFLFANRTEPLQHRVFQIEHNYANLVEVSPKHFALGPNDQQHVSVSVSGLLLMEGQQEGRWPLWIFVNDNADGTVESYLLNIIVRQRLPFF